MSPRWDNRRMWGMVCALCLLGCGKKAAPSQVMNGRASTPTLPAQVTPAEAKALPVPVTRAHQTAQAAADVPKAATWSVAPLREERHPTPLMSAADGARVARLAVAAHRRHFRVDGDGDASSGWWTSGPESFSVSIKPVSSVVNWPGRALQVRSDASGSCQVLPMGSVKGMTESPLACTAWDANVGVWTWAVSMMSSAQSLRVLRVAAQGGEELVEVFDPPSGLRWSIRLKDHKYIGLYVDGPLGWLTLTLGTIQGEVSVTSDAGKLGTWRWSRQRAVPPGGGVSVVREPLDKGVELADKRLDRRLSGVPAAKLFWIRGRWDGSRFAPQFLERRVYEPVPGSVRVAPLHKARAAISTQGPEFDAQLQKMGARKGEWVIQALGEARGESGARHWVLFHEVH